MRLDIPKILHGYDYSAFFKNQPTNIRVKIMKNRNTEISVFNNAERSTKYGSNMQAFKFINAE